MLRTMVENQRFRAIVVEALLALGLLLLDPFGIAEQKHRGIEAGLAVIGQYFQADPPSKLAVVLIDKETLEDWQVDWPISYAKSADVIHALACAHATGVFFDFTATRKYNLTEGMADLKRAVADSSADGTVCLDGKSPAKIPVFFGKIAGVDSEMNKWLADRHAGFSLHTGESDSVYQAGGEEFPLRALEVDEVSPAFGLIRALPFLRDSPTADDGNPLCAADDRRPRCWTAPLLLIWSAKLDPQQPQVSDVTKCRGNQGWRTIAAGLAGLVGLDGVYPGERYETCPPVLTLKGIDLDRDLSFIDAHGDPTAALSGRFVLVGVDLAGLNDQIATPIHDHLPGVYKHAVALGTLMAEGEHYPTLPTPLTLPLIAFAIYLALETVREFSSGWARRHVWFAAAFGGGVAIFTFIVIELHWPLSLIVEVFGSYGGVVFALFLARGAKYGSGSPVKRQPHPPRKPSR